METPSVHLRNSQPRPLFDIKEDDNTDDTIHFQSTFWDNTDWFDPIFKFDDHPLAQIWLLSAVTLGHPWACGSLPTKSETVYNERKKQQQPRPVANEGTRLFQPPLIELRLQCFLSPLTKKEYDGRMEPMTLRVSPVIMGSCLTTANSRIC